MLFGLANLAQAEVLTLDRAEIGVSSDFPGVFPKDTWTWTPVSLPHSLFLDPPPCSYCWYRVRFHLDQVPYGGQSLFLPKAQLTDLTIYVNRAPVWKLHEAFASGVVAHGLRVDIPHGLLRPGENTIHLQTLGTRVWYSGVSRIYVGDTATLSRRAAIHKLLRDEIRIVSAAAFGVIGLLSLWLWLRAGRDAVLFWYGVSGVILLISTLAWYVSLWNPEAVAWRLGLVFMRFHGYLVPLFILHLRLAGRRYLWLESALWIVLLGACLSMSLRSFDFIRHIAWTGWGLAFSVLPALLTIPLLASPRLRTKPAVILLVLADFAACLLPLHDWGIRFGILDFERLNLVNYAPWFVMLAAAAPIIERVQAGRQAAVQNRVELERRVAEKTRAIEASHEQLREVQREAALAEERRRIMADMHDGLGARLVALLSVVQSGKAKHGEISEGIASALDELRLTVDSVQPVEGDVGVVLGNVRHRMRSVFERAGIRLIWNVSALPRMENLTPERILAIQRIFLEVFSNAIRHSGARTVSVFTMRVPGAARIVIEDDGHGFDQAEGHAGTGLHNLEMRALQAGGALQVESMPGKGTRVTLSLPLEGEVTPEPLPNTGQKTAEYPVQGMAADAVSS